MPSSPSEFHPFQSIQELEQTLLPKAGFLDAVREALAMGNGFAAAKIGHTERQLLVWLKQRTQNVPFAKLHVREVWVKKHGLEGAGLFPADANFYAEYGQHFLSALRELDFVGLWSAKDRESELGLINALELCNRFTGFGSLHPDHSIPDNAANCYLDSFRGKRLLIVNPFGNLLAARAKREIFEGVWRTSGKKFFEPAAVEGLEFPYGFARETWARYATTLDLLREIKLEIERREFDVALIGAGGMGIPLAAHVKQLGKVGIMLGGHLQVVFGVKGRRWNNEPKWRDVFYNEWWIDMPAEYRPKEGDKTGENAYW